MNENETAVRPASKKENTSRAMAVSALEWIELFVISFACVLLFITFIVRHSPVDGGSMRETLHDGDFLLVSDLFYTPERGDIVVVQSDNYGYDTPLIKRVIARGGDVLDIDFDTWTVTVNGEVVDEPYILRGMGPMHRGSNYAFPLTVPEGYLFVMGDNRNGSTDSRFIEVGYIDERHVIGKAFFRLFPTDAFGSLYD